MLPIYYIYQTYLFDVYTITLYLITYQNDEDLRQFEILKSEVNSLEKELSTDMKTDFADLKAKLSKGPGLSGYMPFGIDYLLPQVGGNARKTNKDYTGGQLANLIDVIISAHKPEDEESKRLPFAQAATGAIGVETLLPLSLEMYHNESLPLNKIIETLTINPAKILNIKKGTLAKGSDGDICIFDLEAPWKVNADKLKSKSKNTAIENRNLQGKILMTYLNGELVYSN